jgi:hypothetical protein
MALGREGRSDGAARCLLISVALGALLYLATLVWQWRSRWLRVSDGFVFALLAGPVFAGAALGWYGLGRYGAPAVAGANLLLLLWQARGFLRRLWARRAK